MENFCRADIALQPRQLEFAAAARSCDQPGGPIELGFGGARSGGKTFIMLAQMGIDDCQRRPYLKCLLLRKVGKSGIEQFQDMRLRLFGRIPHRFTNRGILTFPNGSRIIAGHFKSESDVDAYLGLEYDVIGLEEATTLTSRKIKDIATCCRTNKPDWRPRIYSSANPGGVGHAGYRARFILPYLANQAKGGPKNYGGETRFVPARVEDNRFSNPEYVNVLNSLTGWQLRAWRYGDWDIAAGQFFTAFRRETHVVGNEFDVNRIVRWSMALDYGTEHYTVALVGGEDRDGTFFIVDSHVDRRMLPSQHAEKIKAMLDRIKIGVTDARGLTVADLASKVAGTDIFAKESNQVSIAQQFEAAGIKFGPANTDRINGWAEVTRRLGDPPRGIKPTLYIHQRCAMLIEQLPEMQHDPKRPEDVLKVDVDEDGNGGDDGADCARYLLATKLGSVQMVKFGS